MQQSKEKNADRMYYPSQDEIRLLQDILDFISLINDADAQWMCKDEYIDIFYISLREGSIVDAKWERDGETYTICAWVEINNDTIDVYIGNRQKEVAIKQVFKNYHPFKYGEYGAVTYNNANDSE